MSATTIRTTELELASHTACKITTATKTPMAIKVARERCELPLIRPMAPLTVPSRRHDPRARVGRAAAGSRRGRPNQEGSKAVAHGLERREASAGGNSENHCRRPAEASIDQQDYGGTKILLASSIRATMIMGSASRARRVSYSSVPAATVPRTPPAMTV